MCILSYLPDGVLPDEESLVNGGMNNPDGHGWAIASPHFDTIIMGHSLDIYEAYDEFSSERKHLPEGPALFHSRWATHGSITLANCHPFIVSDDSSTVLGHNGVLPSDAHPSKGDDRSDTKILAQDLLPKRFSTLDKRSTRKNLARWAGNGNKLLILSVSPAYRRSVYLVNAKAGEWDRKTGIWHSNTDYLYTLAPRRKWSLGYGQAKEEEIVGQTCWYCDSSNLGTVTHYCFDCDTCQDCGEKVSACMCRLGEWLRTSAERDSEKPWWAEESGSWVFD